MKRLTRYSLYVLFTALGTGALSGLLWYANDRSGMLGTLCDAGLPNLSRPSVIPADALGCRIVGRRRRVNGVLIDGFEASNLVENNLPPPPPGGGPTGSTWFSCNRETGCGKRLDEQLDKQIPGLCDTGLAFVVADGWATETLGDYGHLGLYAREFFVDRLVAVRPPPSKFVTRMRLDWEKAGIDDCS